MLTVLLIGTMCEEDLNWLRNWKPRHTAQDGSKLSTTGWNEIFQIGLSVEFQVSITLTWDMNCDYFN